MHQLTAPLASQFARVVLGHVTREYPNKLTHALAGPEDALTPRALHPIFYGSYDWHSCVHGYWLMLRLLERFPDLPEHAAIIDLVERQWTETNVAGELAYIRMPQHRGFERPYGWAWLLALAGQTTRLDLPQARRWVQTLAPLTDAFVELFAEFLPKASYPLRVGTHFNTAFALALTLDFARETGQAALERQITETAHHWYFKDEGCQAWEPGGDEFLSPALMEAELMRRVLPPAQFPDWLGRFLPALAQSQPATLFEPATVTDRSDGKIAHLDGLNLSRAWCQRSLARALPPTDPRYSVLMRAAERHIDSALGQVSGDYMGEHWLATFATLALEA